MRDVVRVTWNWRERSTASAAMDRRNAGLRRAAILQAAVMGLVGLLLFWIIGHQMAGRVVWALAIVVLLLGLIWPRGYRPVHALGQWLGKGAGRVLGVVFLAPAYLLLFMPVAWLLRLQGRDLLQRSNRAPQHTYWIARPAKERGTNITDQFLREDKAARLQLRPVGTSDHTERSSR